MSSQISLSLHAQVIHIPLVTKSFFNVGFSFHSFIDVDRIMAKRTNSSGGPAAKSSQMDLLHCFIFYVAN